MTDDEILSILKNAKTVAVVGISDKPDRESFQVADFLMKQGYRVLPVNPTVDQVLGRKAFGSLREIEEPVDVVDIFRRPDAVMPIVEDAIAIRAKVVWMQLGVINEEAAQRARAAGLTVVMDHCMKQEYKRLLGEGEQFAEGMN